MKLIGFCLIILVFAGTLQLRAQVITTKTLTARQVISEMQTHLTCPWSSETVDTFKTGNPDDVVTGNGSSFWSVQKPVQL